VSLLIDGVVNETNSSGLNNTAYIWTKSFTDEDYNWTCSAVDNDSATTTQGVRHFNVNTTPFIEFVSPTYDNETNLTTTIPAYVNLTETYFENLTINLYNSDGLNQSVTFTNATRDYNFTSCLCDDWYLNATTCTTTGQCNSTETRHYLIDVTEPIINITYPTETINYHVINTNLDLNWTAIDTHLDSCWYNYNETNTTVTCGDNTTTINITDYSIRNVTLYANDTFGNENSVTRSWDYLVFENSRTFSNSTLIGTLEDFTLNVTVNGIEINSGTLVYNGTSISNSITSSGEIRLIYLNNYLIPLFASDSNVTFYWTLGLSDGSFINTSSSIQNVETINLDNCSVYTNQLFNISLFSERTKTPLNGTIEIFYEVQNNFSDNSIINLSGNLKE